MLFSTSKQSFPTLPGQLTSMTGVVSGVVTPKDKTKSNPLARGKNRILSKSVVSLYLILCLQVFVISAFFFCLKGCLLCVLQFHIFYLNKKGSACCLVCKGHIMITFHVIFGVPLSFLISTSFFHSSVSFFSLRWTLYDSQNDL